LSVTLSEEAEALGLRLASAPETEPRVASDGRTIVFWLMVDGPNRFDPNWQGWGREVPISISWAAGGPQKRTFERTFVITVRDR
jgi:hypothetical protein